VQYDAGANPILYCRFPVAQAQKASYQSYIRGKYFHLSNIIDVNLTLLIQEAESFLKTVAHF